VWSVPSLRGDEVERAEVAKALVAALLAPGAGAVGVTTGLVGAGGYRPWKKLTISVRNASRHFSVVKA
jgi:hypothetical protein